MNLFDLTQHAQALQDLIDSHAESNQGDITDVASVVDDWGKEYDINAKVDSICSLIREYGARAEAQKEEAKRLNDRAKVAENKVKRLKDWLVYCMDNAGYKSLKTGIFEASLREASQQSIEITGDVPDPYLIVKKEIDKTAIKDAIKAGVIIDFARLLPKTKYVAIK